MKINKEKKYKWSRSDYNNLTTCYMDGDDIVAFINPSETKDGRLVWNFTINNGTPKLITSQNCKKLGLNVNSSFLKKRDVKKAVEQIISDLNK